MADKQLNDANVDEKEDRYCMAKSPYIFQDDSKVCSNREKRFPSDAYFLIPLIPHPVGSAYSTPYNCAIRIGY